MARKPLTVSSLARESGESVDDTLLALWDRDIEYPVSPESVIRPQDVARARSACGVPSIKDRLTVAFWVAELGMSRSQFQHWASTQGVSIGDGARKLPKGGLARIERAARATARVKDLPAAAPTPSKKPTRLEWREIGHRRESIKDVSADDIERIHYAIAQDFRDTSDPIAPAGVRDRTLLESAVGRPSTGMFGTRKYPTVEMSAAALMQSLVQNHPFFNGNKRTALVSLLVYLDENSLVLNCTQDEIFRWTVRIASHKLNADSYLGDRSDIEVYLMTQWLVPRCRNVEAGERAISFADLRRRLTALGCAIQIAGNRGGRAVVTRQVEVVSKSIFGSRNRIEQRKYAFPYGGDGREVGKGHLKELRRELHLSEEFGVDSATFYGGDKQPVDQFIAQYRKTLQRLAKL